MSDAHDAPADPRGAGPVPADPPADPPTAAPSTAPRGLLAPSTLRPLELDLRTVFWSLIALWAAALAVLAVLAAVASVEGRTVAVCATGLALGFVALGWERWHAAAVRRRAAAGGAGAEPGEPGEPGANG